MTVAHATTTDTDVLYRVEILQKKKNVKVTFAVCVRKKSYFAILVRKSGLSSKVVKLAT